MLPTSGVYFKVNGTPSLLMLFPYFFTPLHRVLSLDSRELRGIGATYGRRAAVVLSLTVYGVFCLYGVCALRQLVEIEDCLAVTRSAVISSEGAVCCPGRVGTTVSGCLHDRTQRSCPRITHDDKITIPVCHNGKADNDPRA